MQSVQEDDWYDVVCSRADWVLGGPVGAGEAGSSHISRSDGKSGFAKPAFQGPGGICRAAHEKIASDLAPKVGVFVPQVVLWQCPKSDLYSISEKAFRQPLTFEQAGAAITPRLLAGAAEQLAAALVFHSWIGDRDHSNHRGNILLDAESTEDAPRIAMIDHAFSMTYDSRWCDMSNATTIISPYYVEASMMPRDSIAKAVEAVQNISPGFLDEVVGRIPVMYLPEDRSTIIKNTLAARRDTLAAAFEL